MKTQGYSYLRFEPPSGLVDRVIRGFNEFLSLPFAEKINWRCGNAEDPDVGWVPKRLGEKDTKSGAKLSTEPKDYDDNKSFFHYRSGLIPFLDAKMITIDRFLPWIEAMDGLHQFSIMKFEEVLERLDREDVRRYDFVKRFRHPIARSEHTLRLLDYHEPLMPGNKLAKDHIDRNFGTFQIYESHPALALYLPDGSTLEYKPIPDHTLVFPCAKARDITDGELPGIEHGIVVPNDYGYDGSVTHRQAIVFFAHVYPCPKRYLPGSGERP